MDLLEHLNTMAAYNQWANDKLYEVCGKIPDVDRRADRKAFFKSIHGTLNHILLADRLWLCRFRGDKSPYKSMDQELFADFADLRLERKRTDLEIADFVKTLSPEALAKVVSFYSLSMQRNVNYTLGHCVTHMFNHQAHHRGQVTTLVSQLGYEYGALDLLFFPGKELSQG